MKSIADRGVRAIVLMAMFGPGLQAMDRFPGVDCHDLDRLRILHRCDPYAVRFLWVEPRHLPSIGPPRRLRVHKLPTPVSSYHYERRLSLQHLVDKYIDFVDFKPAFRATHRYGKRKNRSPRRQVAAPALHKPPPVDRKKMQKTRDIITLAEYLGDRNTSQMMLPLEPRTGYPTRLIKSPPASFVAPSKIVEPHAPVVHEVLPGETLARLARLYQTTVYDIRRINGLRWDHLLKAGERLTIRPGFKTPPDQIREALRRERFGRYTVKKGDSVIAIARRFKIKPREILELNDLNRHSHLRVGQKLMLPMTQKKIDAVLKRERRFKYAADKRFRHKLRVTATAYTSHRGQTDRTPFLAAWNNRIRPGMKIIAVSSDLIRRYGITNGTKVKISGLPGIYTVRDKMHPKWRRKIDIYMGTNRRKALRWGRRSVVIYW